MELRHITISQNKKYKPWLPSPPSLVALAGNIVNTLPLPICWHWDIDDVVKWLWTKIQLPQYKDCFVKNFINGRKLLLIDASVCTKMGIRNFQHIKQITQGVRELFNVDLEKYTRSISLPLRYPWTHYLLYRVPTGPIKNNAKATNVFRKMGIISVGRVCPLDHWELMYPQPNDFPSYLYGYGKNKNLRKHHFR